jgi:hypothetical protein
VLKLKYDSIECRILEGLSAEEALLAEIDGNLMRANLMPSERGAHHAKRKELYLKLHPETEHGGAPGKAGGGKKAKGAKTASTISIAIALGSIHQPIPVRRLRSLHPPHLRRTARSLMSAAGADRDIAKRVLGSRRRPVKRIYDRHGYLAAKAVALQRLADLIEITRDHRLNGQHRTALRS